MPVLDVRLIKSACRQAEFGQNRALAVAVGLCLNRLFGCFGLLVTTALLHRIFCAPDKPRGNEKFFYIQCLATLPLLDFRAHSM